MRNFFHVCSLITARIRRMTEGNVFTLSTISGGRGYPVSGLNWGVPHPRSELGGYPIPGLNGGYPILGLNWGVPYPRYGRGGGTQVPGVEGGYPRYPPIQVPGQDGGTPPITRMGYTPPSISRMGYPPPR